MDLDGDGVITAAEMAEFEKRSPAQGVLPRLRSIRATFLALGARGQPGVGVNGSPFYVTRIAGGPGRDPRPLGSARSRACWRAERRRAPSCACDTGPHLVLPRLSRARHMASTWPHRRRGGSEQKGCIWPPRRLATA